MGAGGAGRKETEEAVPATAATRRGTPCVVVGLDGSAASWDALAWGRGEARRLGASVIAVFVSPVGATGLATLAVAVGGALPIDSALIHDSRAEQADHLRAQLAAEAVADPTIVFVHSRGDPAREILRVAKESNADVIVVGRSTKVRHHVAGSLGHCLVGKRHAPVVVVVP
jgi:nucleotide-binding universal stress UspA family protein